MRKTQAVETPAERITTFTYDDQNQLETLTQKGDANTSSATISFSYDSNGNIASITDALGHRLEVLEYDIAGNPLKIKDYLGFIWHYHYDVDERLKSITDPLNQTTSYEYDAAGNLTAVIDEAKNRWAFAYNLSDKLTQVVNPLQHNKKLIYNLDLRPIQVIDEEGKSHYSSYDNEGRLLTAIDGAGNEIVHHYDETPSNPVDSRVPVKIEFPTYSQLLSFDRLLRVTGITEVLDDNTRYSSHYEYDVGGNLTSYTDQQDNSTGYEYDALGRLIQITDALEGVTHYTYDARSNVIAITDANQNVTRYEYDKNDNLVKIIRPNEEATQYEYDAADNQTAKIDPQGQKVAYQYDELSRLTQVDYYAADNQTQPVKTVSLTYDYVGNLLSIEDGTTSAAYTYDALGRQKTERVNYGPFSLNYAYEYYANGLKKSFTGPSGKKVTYSYDDNNRLSAIDIPNAGRITYNQYHWNSPAKITLPGGSQVNLDYDPVMRLQSKVVKDPLKQVLMNYQYEYSPTDSLTKKITEHGEYRYEYDKLYRLLKATNPVLDDEHYTYDPLGNRLTASQVTEEATYDSNNALLSDNGAAFEYLNHNLVKKTKGDQVTHYDYNIENRLTEVKEDNTPLANYGYDPFGRRLWKEVEGVKTYFLYSDEGLVGEYDENGVEIKGYGYLPDSFWTSDPLFQTQNGSYYWYQNDQLGTPQKLTDNQGNIVWEAHYKAFGEAQVETDLIDNPLRFPGQYFDTETELHYNYQRDYDPSTGRYLQFDPIGLEGGLNGYLYAHSDPVNLYDPTGEIAPIIGIAATQYARCLAACAATNVIANAIGGAACGFVENNCWSSCLNPLNWGGRRPKLGKPRKSSPPESCPLPNCFSAGTLVHTEEGLKPIEEIQISEKVLSMDENTGTTSYQLVTDLIQGERQYRLVKITLDSGKSIEATAEHPFYIKGKGWNPASSLSVGQVLELHDGTLVVVKEVLTRVRRDLVYNLTVANTHNYFVGEDGVLVHNATGLRWNKGCLGPNDLDWRNTGKTLKDALNEAFKRTGQTCEEFQVTKWAKNVYGKSRPVEYRGPNQAEVNIDFPHEKELDKHGKWQTGPDAPHVGWQFGKKPKTVGHILLKEVPCGRTNSFDE